MAAQLERGEAERSEMPAPAVPAVQVSWISTSAELARLGGEWADLFGRVNPENVFLSFGWMSTWWKHFGKGRLAVVAVRDPEGRLVALAPFYIGRSWGGLGARRLGFLADERVGSDHLNVLADDAFRTEAMEEIARVLFAHHHLWDYIELRDTANSPLLAALSAALLGRGMRVAETTRSVCRYILLPATFEKYLAGINASVRTNYRRRWRVLRREHETRCLAVSDAAGVERHFPALIALHRLRFEARKEHSAFLARGVPEFHTDAMRILAAEGFARLYLLEADGEAVAAIYGFALGGTFQFYQCGRHPGWSRYGLGQLLIGIAIEQNIAAGRVTFDFLRGDESYKAHWADRSRANMTLRFFDQQPASVAARWCLGIAAAGRRAAHDAKTRLSALRLRETAQR